MKLTKREQMINDEGYYKGISIGYLIILLSLILCYLSKAFEFYVILGVFIISAIIHFDNKSIEIQEELKKK